MLSYAILIHYIPKRHSPVERGNGKVLSVSLGPKTYLALVDQTLSQTHSAGYFYF